MWSVTVGSIADRGIWELECEFIGLAADGGIERGITTIPSFKRDNPRGSVRW